jgi:PAS domain S-box-containing protein
MYSMVAEFCKELPIWYNPKSYVSPLIGVNPFVFFETIELDKVILDFNELEFFLRNFKLETEKDIISYLNVSKKGIVITDLNKNVVWTSFSFEKMTGYKCLEVFQKNLSFLQRKKRNQLSSEVRKTNHSTTDFTITVFNYKKNGTKYLCKIEVFPLYDKNNNHTHFIAFETNLNN